MSVKSEEFANFANQFAERVLGGCFFGACEALTVKDCET